MTGPLSSQPCVSLGETSSIFHSPTKFTRRSITTSMIGLNRECYLCHPIKDTSSPLLGTPCLLSLMSPHSPIYIITPFSIHLLRPISSGILTLVVVRHNSHFRVPIAIILPLGGVPTMTSVRFPSRFRSPVQLPAESPTPISQA